MAGCRQFQVKLCLASASALAGAQMGCRFIEVAKLRALVLSTWEAGPKGSLKMGLRIALRRIGKPQPRRSIGAGVRAVFCPVSARLGQRISTQR